MQALRVKNWERYQHYRRRRPPWIKIHVKLLADRRFMALSLSARGLLMQLWVLASELDGHVPYDIEELRFRLRVEDLTDEDLKPLLDGGFLVLCKHVQASDSTCSVSGTIVSPEVQSTETKIPPPTPPAAAGGDGKGPEPTTPPTKRRTRGPSKAEQAAKVGRAHTPAPAEPSHPPPPPRLACVPPPPIDTEGAELWRALMRRAAATWSPQVCQTWIERLYWSRGPDGRMLVTAPNDLIRTWILDHLWVQLQELATEGGICLEWDDGLPPARFAH